MLTNTGRIQKHTITACTGDIISCFKYDQLELRKTRSWPTFLALVSDHTCDKVLRVDAALKSEFPVLEVSLLQRQQLRGGQNKAHLFAPLLHGACCLLVAPARARPILHCTAPTYTSSSIYCCMPCGNERT